MDPIPYCGPSPVPGALAERWNFDPVILAALAVAAVLHAALGRPGRPLREQLAFWAALALVAATLVSPLCALAVALFSVRMSQHLLLTLVAAPLLVHGCQARSICRPRTDRRAGDRAEPLLASLIFAACWWLWHAPAPYELALRNGALYLAMQLTLLASACALWRVLLGRDETGGSLLAGIASAVQMGLLGALLTFAPEPLYAHHVATVRAWSLSALEDQQIAGLLCWVPGCGVFAFSTLSAVKRLLYGSADGLSPNELQEAR